MSIFLPPKIKKRFKMQSIAKGKDLEKWCNLIVLNDKKTKDVTSFNEKDVQTRYQSS
jgi:hypothetical protein